MSFDPGDVVREIFAATVAAHQRFAVHGVDGTATAATALGRALAAGRKVLAFGNGGSAADAQHLAGELVGRFEAERRALAAKVLVTLAVGARYIVPAVPAEVEKSPRAWRFRLGHQKVWSQRATLVPFAVCCCDSGCPRGSNRTDYRQC